MDNFLDRIYHAKPILLSISPIQAMLCNIETKKVSKDEKREYGYLQSTNDKCNEEGAGQ